MRFLNTIWGWIQDWRKQRAWDRLCDDLRNDRAYFVVTMPVEGGMLKTFINSRNETAKVFIPEGVDESEIDFGDPFLAKTDCGDPFVVEMDDEPATCESDGLPDGEGDAGTDAGPAQA